MAYITVSAGWNANHLSSSFFSEIESDEGAKELWFDENGNPLVTFVERKGAARLHSYTGHDEMITNEAMPMEIDEKNSDFEENLVGQVYGWEGEVEVHHQERQNQYGWSKKWNQKWNKANRDYLTILPDLHKAEPPELTSFIEGYNRMSEYRHLDEIEENLRRMAESSNRIEGFVLFADGFDGFSGVNERLLEFVNDEYDRKSLLFNVNEPWSRTTPYSMVCQAMSLLSPATLNIPIEVGNCEDSEIQSDQLNPIIKQFLQSFTKTSLPNLAQFLLPRRQNILSLFSSVPSGSIYEYFTQNKPEKDEKCYSWLPKHSFKQHRSFSTFSILSGPSDYLRKSADPKVISSNAFMKRSDLSEAIALWNYESLKCVTESIVMPYTNAGDYRMISIRNNNQIHFHIATQLEKLKRFSSKLTRMEDDDWIEKIEALETIRDNTRSTPLNDSTESSSDSD